MKLSLDSYDLEVIQTGVEILSPDTPKAAEARDALDARLPTLDRGIGKIDYEFSEQELELIHAALQLEFDDDSEIWADTRYDLFVEVDGLLNAPSATPEV